LALEQKAKFVLTDSGGIQEETAILEIPCFTLRDNTERQETLHINNRLIKPSEIGLYLKEEKIVTIPNVITGKFPFGSGTASKNIIDILETKFYNGDELNGNNNCN